MPENAGSASRWPSPLVAGTLALFVLTGVGKLLGFAEKQLIAYYFGADAHVDALFVSLSVVTVVYLIVRELLEPALLPLLVAAFARGGVAAGGGLVRAAGLGIVGLVAPLLLALALAAEPLARALAPGFSEPGIALTARLLRVALPGALLLGASNLTYALLNARHRFAAPAWGDVVLKAVALAACVLGGATPLGVVALALGVVAGGGARLAVHLLALRSDLRGLWRGSALHPGELHAMALLMAPLVLGVLFSQASELADNFFSSQLAPGAIAARTFARKLVDLPILLLPYSMSIVLFPHLSRLYGTGAPGAFESVLGRSCLGLLLVFTPLSVACVAAAPTLVAVAFEHGAFGAQARDATAWTLRCYALGLVPFAIEAVLVPAFYATRDTRTPVAFGIAGVILHVALTAALIGTLGVGGVALALVLSKSAKVAALGAVLLRRRRLRFGVVFAPLARAALAGAGAALALVALAGWLPTPGADAPLAREIAHLAAAGALALAAFAGVLLLLRGPEWSFARAGATQARRALRESRGRH